mgnify:CR=1 FL=1
MNFATTNLHDVKKITSRIKKLDNNNGYVLTLGVTQEDTNLNEYTGRKMGDKHIAHFDLQLFSDTKSDLEIV